MTQPIRVPIIPFENKELFESMRPLVVDFELSCLLRHAGVPQKAALYWHLPAVFANHPDKNRRAFLSNVAADAHCAAYTSEELGRFLDSQFCTVHVGVGYVFIDLMACTFKKMEGMGDQKVDGSGLVLQMMRGAEDKTEAHCRSRAIILLEGKKILSFPKKADGNNDTN